MMATTHHCAECGETVVIEFFMNTHETSFWIEPASDPEIAKPTALLEAAVDQVEAGDPPKPAIVFADPPVFDDMGGHHLTALDDW
jgi:hypothetical protein